MTARTKAPVIVLIAMLAALLAATVIGLAIGGGLMDQGFGDPGELVRVGLPIAKGAMNLSMAISIGTLVFASFAIEDGSPQLRSALNLAGIGAIGWLFFGVANFLLSYLSVSGASFSLDPSFSRGLMVYATEIALGQALAINLLGALLIGSVSFGIATLRLTAAMAIAGLAAPIPLAVIGHSASSANHSLAVNSLGLHLAAISVWVGGLSCLYWLRNSPNAQALAKRYSSLALASFVVVAISGLGSSLTRIQSLSDLASSYAAIIGLKIVLLLALGLLGAYYRARILSSALGKGFYLLVVLELALMGLALGLGAALARTAPPVRQGLPEVPTPAELLTGEKLPPAWSAETFLTQWKPDLLWLTVAAFGIFFYLAAVSRLAKRGDSWPLGRTISWVSGLLLLAFVTSGSLNAYQEYLFSVHMIAHMALTMAVPVLLVPGAPVTLLMRSAQKREDDSMGAREWVLWVVHTRYARFIAHPIFAAVNFAASLLIFYFTPLFSWSTRDHLGHEWMVAHFLITGYLFAQALIGIDPGPVRLGYPIRLVMLIAVMAFHAFFGLALMGGSGLLLPDWYGAMGRTWGDDPLTDQQTGGAIAWGVGEIPTIVLTIMVAVQWYRADRRDSTRLDRASDRSGGADLDSYNEMLAKLNRKN